MHSSGTSEMCTSKVLASDNDANTAISNELAGCPEEASEGHTPPLGGTHAFRHAAIEEDRAETCASNSTVDGRVCVAAPTELPLDDTCSCEFCPAS